MASAAESTFSPNLGANRKSGARIPYVVRKGILSKKSRSKFMTGPWTLRTVVLNSHNKLLYFDGKVLKGEIILAGTTVSHLTQDSADGKMFPFQISNISCVKMSQTTSLTLAAGSFQEADDWVSSLNKASAGSSPTEAAGYITFQVRSFLALTNIDIIFKLLYSYLSQDVAASGANARAVDARELKEKRMRANGSKDNLLKYGDMVDSSDDEDDEETFKGSDLK